MKKIEMLELLKDEIHKIEIYEMQLTAARLVEAIETVIDKMEAAQ